MYDLSLTEKQFRKSTPRELIALFERRALALSVERNHFAGLFSILHNINGITPPTGQRHWTPQNFGASKPVLSEAAKQCLEAYAIAKSRRGFGTPESQLPAWAFGKKRAALPPRVRSSKQEA